MQFNYSIRLKEPVTVYCPVMKAEISIISQEVNELGLFSKVLVWAIGKGYSALEISEITGLPTLVVNDEIDYLVKIGLIEETGQEFKLTELGSSYFRKIVVVENFNDRKEQVLVNCVSGEILEDKFTLIEKSQLSSKDFLLSQRIIPELYWNLNPSNSKYFVLENYNLSPLSPEELELIDVAVQLHMEKDKKRYLPCKIHAVPFPLYKEILNSVDDNHLIPREETAVFNETHSLLPFMYPIKRGKFLIKNRQLDLYRNLLTTLEKLKEFDRELISDKAEYILELYQYERYLQSMLPSEAYFDGVSGVITTSINPEYRLEENIRNEVPLPVTYDLDSILQNDISNIIKNLTGEEIQGDEWELTFVVQKELYLKISDNPMNVLIEVRT